MGGHTKQDRIRNECIKEKVGLTTILEKKKKNDKTSP